MEEVIDHSTPTPPIALYHKAAQSAMCDTLEAESDIHEAREDMERGASVAIGTGEFWAGKCVAWGQP